MSSQTSLSTEASRTAASKNTDDYTGSVAAHIAGDWGGHNQVAVYDYPFGTLSLASGALYAAHNVAGAQCLRMLVTINDTNYAVVIPGIPVGTYTGGGTGSGSPSALPPEFTLEPVGTELSVGSSVTVTVDVSGTQPILLQWAKDGVAIAGANSSSYTISDFQATDAGNYTCVAFNSVGQVSSTVAVLSVRASTASTVPVREGVSSGGA